MTTDQLDEIESCNTEFRRIHDVLELHELRLRNFGDLKCDLSDPCSVSIEEVADAISLCRDNLSDAIELLRCFKGEDDE